MIEDAYTTGPSLDLVVWCDVVWCDNEAGPFQAILHLGASWQLEGLPREYVRGRIAEVLTLPALPPTPRAPRGNDGRPG